MDNNSFKTKIIDNFALKVLKYKIQIDTFDESFFVTKNYDNDVEGEDSQIINSVLDLKHIWSNLLPENKTVIFEYMQLLTDLSAQYAKIKWKL